MADKNDLKMGDVKSQIRGVSSQIRDLLNGLTRDTGVYVEYVEVEQIHTDEGIVGYVVQLDTRIGK